MHFSRSLCSNISSLHAKVASRFSSFPNVFSETKTNKQTSKYKAVIFDKDGTLICFDKMWTGWANRLTERLVERFGTHFELPIYNLLGVCVKTSKVKPGLLAEGTQGQIETALTNFFADNGIDKKAAHDTVVELIETADVSKENLKELQDVKHLFSFLRRSGVKVCICTSDNRENTERTLNSLGVTDLVDITKTGDDDVSRPKPDPFHAQDICSKLNLLPSEVMMVGDTPTDILFAKNANLGHAVGVLSGIGEAEDLKQAWFNSLIHGFGFADISACPIDLINGPNVQRDPRFSMVHSIADILPILFPNSLIPVALNDKEDDIRLRIDTPIRLIVFDKDGSLASVYPRWSNWATEIAERLSKVVSQEFADLFLRVLGFCEDSQRVIGSVLAAGAIPEIRDRLVGLLLLHGVRLREVNRIFDEVWLSPSSVDCSSIPCAEVALDRLRRLSIKLAVNTSDERSALDMFLLSNKFYDKFDYAISVEQQYDRPKPAADSLLHICKKLQVHPEETLVVGDTRADLLCGRRALCGGTIGVLSGFSTTHHLFSLADVIAPDISYLPELIQRIKS